MSVDAVGLLQDPVRRSVYEYVAASEGPVARNDVAEALGLGRTLVAFHLDKLATAGLLDVSFARRSGRTGPGAGRPSKLYRRSAVEHVVSLPPRDYVGLADTLATAVAGAGVEDAAYAAARERGLALAARQRAGAPVVAAAPGAPPEPERTLAELGYEPYADGDVLRLRNCPFATTAQAHPPLVCGMNLALIEGLLSGLADGAVAGAANRARLDPRPVGCCVAIEGSINNID